MRGHNKKSPRISSFSWARSSLKKKESWSCNFPSWKEYYEQSSEHTRKAFILLSLSYHESLIFQGQNASPQKNCKSRNLLFSHMTNRISWCRVYLLSCNAQVISACGSAVKNIDKMHLNFFHLFSGSLRKSCVWRGNWVAHRNMAPSEADSIIVTPLLIFYTHVGNK